MIATQTVDEALYLLRDVESNASKILGLSLNDSPLKPGQYVSRADANDAPQLTHKSDEAATYLVVCIDLDPPFPSFPILGPILHWIQSGLRAQGSEGRLSSGDIPFIANYRPPRPPPYSTPHRYLFLLYEQPSSFDVKAFAPAGGVELPISSRVRYNLAGFERRAKLGPLVAANYFLSN